MRSSSQHLHFSLSLSRYSCSSKDDADSNCLTETPKHGCCTRLSRRAWRCPLQCYCTYTNTYTFTDIHTHTHLLTFLLAIIVGATNMSSVLYSQEGNAAFSITRLITANTRCWSVAAGPFIHFLSLSLSLPLHWLWSCIFFLENIDIAKWLLRLFEI